MDCSESPIKSNAKYTVVPCVEVSYSRSLQLFPAAHVMNVFVTCEKQLQQ